jgi:hypothetical protein
VIGIISIIVDLSVISNCIILLIVGGGVINGGSSAALTAFATEFGIPVVTTLMGIGAFDTTHPLSMRMLGMHGAAFANYAVQDCDLLIAMGARFDDRVAGVPSQFAPNARRIAHFDIDRAEINKVKAVHWSHVGELCDALEHRARFRTDFFDRIIDTGVRTGEIAPGNRELVSVFITAMVTGMTDALSDDQALHLQAIEAVKAIIAGGLVSPAATRKPARRRAG